ncbi:hypothetical protein QR680_000425 [Steinernema hermaphroditum]|uniref:Uncharacterized protein n=1 Tax=Steinernema hermaphroditum TaxID=289476 RepID=A0AA39LE21_9BILA|nr:hypothetical protein QR680_000425 [Steinernema hermaphroditum]
MFEVLRHCEFVLHTFCSLTSICALIFFRWHHKKCKTLFGMLFTHITTQLVYSITSLAISIMSLVQFTGTLDPNTVHFWRSIICLPLEFYISVSSAFLALDRLFIVLLPLKYKTFRISAKLSVVVIVIDMIAAIFVVIGVELIPGISLNPLFGTYNTLYVLGYVYSCMVYSEIILYVVFFVLYRRVVRMQPRQRNTMRAHHIALFQAITLVIFCLIPNSMDDANNLFFNRLSTWLRLGYIYKHVCLSMSVLMSSWFICFTFAPKNTVMHISPPRTPSSSNRNSPPKSNDLNTPHAS